MIILKEICKNFKQIGKKIKMIYTEAAARRACKHGESRKIFVIVHGISSILNHIPRKISKFLRLVAGLRFFQPVSASCVPNPRLLSLSLDAPLRF